MKITLLAFVFAAAAVTFAAPSKAQEIYVGASKHTVDTPFSLETGEGGADLEAGIRSKRIEALSFLGKPQAHVHGQVSLSGDTSFVAAGLSWKFGDRIYIRPGIGLALHNDRITDFRLSDRRRLDLGSRILFEPEISVGAKLSDSMAVEISWMHISHARLLSSQNPGMDFIGARLVLKLD
jgi:lipid A 3-O-deacylase